MFQALRDSPDPKHREYYGLFHKKLQWRGAKGRVQQSRQQPPQGVQCNLKAGRKLSGRISCMQWSFYIQTKTFRAILDNTVILQGALKPTDPHAHPYTTAASNDHPAARLAVKLTALTSKGIQFFWLQSGGARIIGNMNTLVDQLDGDTLETVEKRKDRFLGRAIGRGRIKNIYLTQTRRQEFTGSPGGRFAIRPSDQIQRIVSTLASQASESLYVRKDLIGRRTNTGH